MVLTLELETLRAARRVGRHEAQLPIYIGEQGQSPIDPRRILYLVENGQVRSYALAKKFGEMLSTPQDYDALITKSTIDLAVGRERVPLLYKPIYRTISEATLTETVNVEDFVTGRMAAVFLSHMEGEEVRMMSRTFGARDTVPILAYTTGVQVTEEMRMYDKGWTFNQAVSATGEAYNALLNHLHLFPLIDYTYPAKNVTPAVTGGADLRVRTRQTLVNAFMHASNDRDPNSQRNRRPSILLAHSSRRFQIEDALQRMLIAGTEYAAFSGISTIIFYDGYAITVAGKTYTYGGVPQNKGYLIDPQGYFVELIKHDLLTRTGNPDVSRLIDAQVVWVARRGVFASIENTTEEITWPD